jgi:NAD(P)-dependent dehydrogenase (short-subunit alcohol dehydrogenase family)
MAERPIALVTGASRGIGRAIAMALARDGWDVVVHFRANTQAATATAREIASLGGVAHLVAADLADPATPERLAAETQAVLRDRPLSALVLSGGELVATPSAELTPRSFDQLMAVNARSSYFIIQAMLPVIASPGRVICLSSAVTRAYFPNMLAYSMSKGAVDVLVKHLAAELGPRGITVNALSPGVIETDMSAWVSSADGSKLVHSIQALKRVGQPQDVAQVAAFLASSNSGWITGEVIDVSGGSKL